MKITKEGSCQKVSIGTSAQSGSIDRRVVTLEKVKVGLNITERAILPLNRMIRLMYAFLNLNNDLYSCQTL